MPKTDPCKKFACAIQKCLSEQSYQEVRCKHVFEEMRQCCLRYKPVSLVCEGYDLAPREFAPETDRPSKTEDNGKSSSK